MHNSLLQKYKKTLTSYSFSFILCAKGHLEIWKKVLTSTMTKKQGKCLVLMCKAKIVNKTPPTIRTAEAKNAISETFLRIFGGFWW